jgi:hypothetical protein
VDRGSHVGGLTSGNDFNSNFLGGYPGYVATSKFFKGAFNNHAGTGVSWTTELSVNPDGLIFPNRDVYGDGIEKANQAMCSSSLPVVNYTQGKPSSLSLILSNLDRPDSDTVSLSGGARSVRKNEIHMRPIDPWVPQYLEDTSFKACVPVADPYLEPPLHFYKDTNKNYGWCAEVYPTQNPYWASLNKKRRLSTPGTGLSNLLVNYPGTAAHRAYVIGNTSHVDDTGALDSKNSCGGTCNEQVCRMTVDSAGASADYSTCKTYLGSSRSGSTGSCKTCDRTVLFDPNQEFQDFPLQAGDTDIEDMLKNDLSHNKSFGCMYSVTSDKTKLNQAYPSSACCGKQSGVSILKGLIDAAAGTGGHLEPQTDSRAPDVRFCGNPVQ